MGKVSQFTEEIKKIDSKVEQWFEKACDKFPYKNAKEVKVESKKQEPKKVIKENVKPAVKEVKDRAGVFTEENINKAFGGSSLYRQFGGDVSYERPIEEILSDIKPLPKRNPDTKAASAWGENEYNPEIDDEFIAQSGGGYVSPDCENFPADAEDGAKHTDAFGAEWTYSAEDHTWFDGKGGEWVVPVDETSDAGQGGSEDLDNGEDGQGQNNQNTETPGENTQNAEPSGDNNQNTETPGENNENQTQEAGAAEGEASGDGESLDGEDEGSDFNFESLNTGLARALMKKAGKIHEDDEQGVQQIQPQGQDELGDIQADDYDELDALDAKADADQEQDELDAAIEDVEDTLDTLIDQIDNLKDKVDDSAEATDDALDKLADEIEDGDEEGQETQLQPEVEDELEDAVSMLKASGKRVTEKSIKEMLKEIGSEIKEDSVKVYFSKKYSMKEDCTYEEIWANEYELDDKAKEQYNDFEEFVLAKEAETGCRRGDKCKTQQQ